MEVTDGPWLHLAEDLKIRRLIGLKQDKKKVPAVLRRERAHLVMVGQEGFMQNSRQE